MGFEQTSYARHRKTFDEHGEGRSKADHAKTWFRSDTIDAWRHERMYRSIDPLLATFPGATWLTVGDGRYGRDAHYIQSRGGRSLATDISGTLLEEAHEMGFIEAYALENAEALSFGDHSFDFVFCKESYHHFPRPMLALYEMLRVASKGVVLIEPSDRALPSSVLQAAVRALYVARRRLQGVKYPDVRYEECGNYVFSISRRELQKVALGLNLPAVAFKGLDDVFEPDFAYLKRDDARLRFLRARARIFASETLARLRAREHGLLVAVILMEPPSETLARALDKHGFDVHSLPRNPYA